MNRQTDSECSDAGKAVFVVAGSFGGIRLDHFINLHFAGFSRERIRKFIRQGNVFVNKTAAVTYQRLREGDVVELPHSGSAIVPQNLPLDIIYEDEDIIVINKSSGVIVHPARGENTGTLANALAYHNNGSFEYGIVHRLDRDTSGVMVFAKNPRSTSILSKQFANGRVQKTYLALVHGIPQPSQGAIELAIGKDARFPDRYCVQSDGKYAMTLYKAVSPLDKALTLLEVQIKTGRTHQIRVHLAHIGHPIAGDGIYGVYGDNSISRCALHSYSLKLRHPSMGRCMLFEAPMPEDMAAVCSSISEPRT